MKIVNGKWQDQHGDPVNNFNVSSLLEIADNVTNVFAFATKFRTSYTYDISDIENGYSKTTPYIVSIGANYDF